MARAIEPTIVSRPATLARSRTVTGLPRSTLSKPGVTAALANVREFTEDLVTCVDLFTSERLQALRTKALDRERAHHATIEHRPLEDLTVEFFLRGNVTHKAAGK